jgi:hypothetical protein
MNELNLTTPSLLFSAISLILLAYTNRFLSYASVVRSLNEKYQENPDKDPTTLNQIRNFVLRLRLIRAMQTLGAGSLIFCLAAMFLYFINLTLPAEIFFGIGMIMLACSLGLCIWEVQISTEAISLHLQNIRRRQREQDPFMGNALRRNANRREGESLGEQNTRKNQEKQRKEKQEREERKAKERQQQAVETSKKESENTQTPKQERTEERKQEKQQKQQVNNNNSKQEQQAQKKQERREQKGQTTQPSIKPEAIDSKQEEKAQADKTDNAQGQNRKGDTARKFNNRTNKNNQPQVREERKAIQAQEITSTEEAKNKVEVNVEPAKDTSSDSTKQAEKVIEQTINFETKKEEQAQPVPSPKQPSERKIFANRKLKEDKANEEVAPKPLSRYQLRQLALKQQEQNGSTTEA